MGYQVVKKIAFDEKQTKPVSILKGAILENDNGNHFIQLKLCNTSNDILSKASVLITCFNQDHAILGTQAYTYDKIFVKSGDTFGTDVPIPLEFCDTDTFTVEFTNEIDKLQVSTRQTKHLNLLTKICIGVAIFICIVAVLCILPILIGSLSS